MTKYKVTVQGITFKTFESDSGYKISSLMKEVETAIADNKISGYDKTKGMNIQVSKED